jgi:DnaB-like helicase N terminal domain/AAA domain
MTAVPLESVRYSRPQGATNDARPPHDLALERQVLAAGILASESIGNGGADPSDFYSEANATIWAALQHLHSAGEPIDSVELEARLQKTGDLQRVGGSEYLLDLTTGGIPACANVDRLRLLARERAALQVAREVQFALLAGDGYERAFERLEQARAALAEAKGGTKPRREQKRLQAVALTGRARILELATIPPVYVWQNIVVAATIVLLAGPSGQGKTTLLFLILAARLNKGGPVELLGHCMAPSDPTKWVIIIEAEHAESSSARKLIRSLALLDIDDEALDHVIIVARKSVQLGSPEWLDIVEMVADGKVSDIALDTLSRVAPGDANDEREQVAIFNQLAATIEKAPASTEKPIVWVVAHTRKGAAGDSLDDVGGSMQRAGQADTVMLIKGTKVDGHVTSSKVRFEKLREPPDEHPAPVEFSIVGSVLTTSGVPPKDGRPLTVRIVELLERLGPQTKGAIKKAMGRSDGDIEAALTELFAGNRLRTSPQTVRGRERKTFQLAQISRDGSRDVGF